MTEKVKKTRRRLVYRVPDHRPTDDPERIKAMERRAVRHKRIMANDCYARDRLLEIENGTQYKPETPAQKLAKLAPLANLCGQCAMPYEHINHALGINQDAHPFQRTEEWKRAERLRATA